MGLVIVIQARLASTRLPGKVLLPAAGRPLLSHLLERVRATSHATRVIVATTRAAEDEAIVRLCDQLQVESYRGHPSDCLDRHYQVGRLTGAEAVVKIPSDCPLIDPAVIDRVLGAWFACVAEGQACDYMSNLHPASWPDGNDVEVISMRALAEAAAEADDPFDREHTTPFIWSRPERFRLENVRWGDGLDLSRSHRLVVDWSEDYALVREIIETLEPRAGRSFGVDAIVRLLARDPALASRNARHLGYSHLNLRPTAASARH
jgi:spore coat polysaccharide biosynthesis protein SpsF